MTTARQASNLPSNKLTIGASVAAIVGTQTGPLVEEIWPQLVPAVLAGPVATGTMAALLALLAGLAVGWFVPDAPNVPR